MLQVYFVIDSLRLINRDKVNERGKIECSICKAKYEMTIGSRTTLGVLFYRTHIPRRHVRQVDRRAGKSQYCAQL